MLTEPEVLDMATLGMMSKDPDCHVRQSVATSPKIGRKTRLRLSEDSEDCVRLLIAKREDNTAKDLQRMAMREENIWVLKAIARNRKTDGKTLDELVQKSPDVWEAVARNPNTLESTLDVLATSQSFDVLLGVLDNKNTGKNALLSLKKHKNCFIRERVYYRLFHWGG